MVAEVRRPLRRAPYIRASAAAAALTVIIACVAASGCGAAQPEPVWRDDAEAVPCAVREPRASTLDAGVQRVVREGLDAAVARWHLRSAVAVVIDARSGAILARAGRRDGRDEPQLASSRPLVTGSTLKTFTIAAALDAGTIKADDEVDCATRAYGSAQLTDAASHGVLSISDALAVSSNVGASRVYDTLGLPRFLAALRAFHLGDAPSSLPAPTDATGIQAALLAAGELHAATPLQVAAAYAAIFDNGLYHAPALTRAELRVGEPVVRFETARAMEGLLEASVGGELGTGKFARVLGHHVAGKTGTADLGDGAAYASFVGTVLDVEPRIVLLVGLESAHAEINGPTAAAPTFAWIARGILRDRGAALRE